jgi:hypothetical protein
MVKYDFSPIPPRITTADKKKEFDGVIPAGDRKTMTLVRRRFFHVHIVVRCVCLDQALFW